jgi:hypothetical protein
MEKIEQSLNDIEAQMADTITKQHLTIARAITSVAENSLIAGKTLDNEFKTVFPELANLEPDYLNKANPFNPNVVIEIKNGKGTGFTHTWDKTDGVLPTRKVMGHYYFDLGKPLEYYTHNAHAMYCVTHKQVMGSSNGQHLHLNSQPNSVGADCKCGNFYNNIANHLYGIGIGKINSVQIERGEHRELFDTTTTYKFEVDNYLNLYHPESDLYIIFNRTAFPAFPFLARPNIFQSKRHDTQIAGQMKFKLDKTWYSSMDARPTILQAVTELIPDDYSSVYDFYDKFRRMSPYKSALDSSATKQSPANPIDPDESGDTRDKLIRELELRLATCLKQIEKTDAYNRELSRLYKTQSAELVDLHRRINQINADKQTDTTIKKVEESAQVFSLMSQLAESQAYITRVQIQGDELTKLDAELSTCKLDIAKYKDLNKGLTDQLLSAKRDLKTKADEHAQCILNINREAVRYSNLEKENARIKAESITQQAKIRDLDTRLLTTAENKPNKEPLETVLSTRCEELTTERNTLTDKYAQLQREHDTNIKAFDAFKSNITRLMTGNK